MRAASKVLCLALAVTAGVLAFRSAAAQGDGNPDVAGSWAGRANFKDYRLQEDGGGRGALAATLTLTQEGATLSGALHVQRRDASADYALTGGIGNGNFYLVNGSAESPVVVSGHVLGRPPHQRIKASAILVLIDPDGIAGEQIVEMELRLAQEPPQAE